MKKVNEKNKYEKSVTCRRNMKRKTKKAERLGLGFGLGLALAIKISSKQNNVL